MISSSNSYDTLREVIIGRELEISKRIADFSFKHFYSSNLNNSIYEEIDIYKIDYDILQERIEDLNNLSIILEKLGIKVYRPDIVDKVVPFKTPTFKSELSSPSNVRDISIIIDDYIIETPSYVRNRYFENINLYKIFNNSYNNGKGGKWIKSPLTDLTEDTIDLTPWDIERDYNNIPKNIQMAIDGAQFLRLDNDIIVNINSYSHYLGYLWVKSFFPNKEFHIVNFADNHIDGALISLNKGTFLVNPNYPNMKDLLPDKFKDFNYLYPEDISIPIDISNKTDINIKIASQRGMNINVLSINNNTVIVDNTALGVIKVLKENNFNVIEVQLRHSEIFGGNLHCSSLDLVRINNRYVVYLTMYKGNKLPKWYLGSSNEERIINGYRGSVSSKLYKEIWQQELKDNPHLFNTRILSYHYNRKDALEEELRLQYLHSIPSNLNYINRAYAQLKGYFGSNQNGIYNAASSYIPKTGKDPHSYGVKASDETKQKMSDSRKGKSFHSEYQIDLLSQNMINNNPMKNPEVAKKVSQALKGRVSLFKGKTHTEQFKQRFSEAAKNRKREKCKYYDKVMDVSNLNRWHNENCKLKERK